MVSPLMKTGLLLALERCLNELLKLDPVTVKKLSGCFGKVVALHCTSPQWMCHVHIEQEYIRLAGWSDEVDVIVTGSIVSLSTLLTCKTWPFSEIPGLTVSGDLDLMKDLQQIYQNCELDWERPLSKILGDMGGHAVAHGFRFTGHHVQIGQDRVMNNLGEYLQEELRYIPTKVEVEGFAQEVRFLAESMDQIECQWNSAQKKYRSDGQ